MATSYTIKSNTDVLPVLGKVKPGDQVTIIGDNIKIEGVKFVDVRFVLGVKRDPAREVTFAGCAFSGPRRAIDLVHTFDLTLDQCTFQDIRSSQPGKDVSAVNLFGFCRSVNMTGCNFNNISSDGVHIGALATADVEQVVIEHCNFWIDTPDQVTLGENGIDIKRIKGPIEVANCFFFGFRPTVPGQNASGSDGAAIVIHNNARNVNVHHCFFTDNTIHVSVMRGPKGLLESSSAGVVLHRNRFVGARSARKVNGMAVRIGAGVAIPPGLEDNLYLGNEANWSKSVDTAAV